MPSSRAITCRNGPKQLPLGCRCQQLPHPTPSPRRTANGERDVWLVTLCWCPLRQAALR